MILDVVVVPNGIKLESIDPDVKFAHAAQARRTSILLAVARVG